MSKVITLPPRPARLSAKLRSAIEAHVTQGLSIAAACDKAGMSRAGYHKAMQRPAVRDYLELVQSRIIGDVKAKRALYQARALEVALDLMVHSKNEAIRARMVEFLASDAKLSPVAVHVDARSVQPRGYVYRRPGEGEARDEAAPDPHGIGRRRGRQTSDRLAAFPVSHGSLRGGQ